MFFILKHSHQAKLAVIISCRSPQTTGTTMDDGSNTGKSSSIKMMWESPRCGAGRRGGVTSARWEQQRCQDSTFGTGLQSRTQPSCSQTRTNWIPQCDRNTELPTQTPKGEGIVPGWGWLTPQSIPAQTERHHCRTSKRSAPGSLH